MADISIINKDNTDYNVKDAVGREALAVVENKGAKNYCPKATEISTTAGAFTDDFAVNIPAGTYMISMTCDVQSQFSLSFYKALPHSGNNIKNVVFDVVEQGVRQTKQVTLSEDAKFCAFYHNSSGDSLTDIMICTKAEWNISNAYVPYGKTNAELTAEKTDMIDVYGRGIEIPANADLHTYTTPGIYFSINSARTATLSNVPTDIISAGFRLVVTEETSVDGSRIRHDLYPLGAAYSNFYSENLGSTSTTYPDGWRPWVVYGPITTNPDSTTLMGYMAPSAKNFYDDQQRQETEMGAIANAGAKNLFDINVTPVRYHATYTLTDGVLSGTSNGDWASYNVPVNLPAGDYIFSAVISNFSRDSGAGEGTIRIRITNSVSGGTSYGTKNITGNGAISIPFSWRGGQFYVQYSFNFSSTESYVNSFTASNSMISPAAITDPTFQPFALPNPTLTPAAIKAVDEGAKNLIQNNCISRILHGVTATTNADGSITVSGSSDYANDFIILYDLYAGDSAASSFNSHLTIKAGTYISKGTGRSDVKLQILEYNTSSDYSIVLAGDADTTFTLTKSYFVARLWISKTANFSTPVTVYPMICTAADWAVSQKFVPYAPTNRELYETCETKATMQQVYGDAVSIPANSDLNRYTTPGIYYAIVANVPTIINTPYNATGFRVVVEKNTLSGAAVFQTIYPTSRQHLEFFRRVYEDSSWSSWYKFEGTKVT